MAVYYLNPAGSDSASGTSPATAWASLYRATQRVWTTGDMLICANGIYNETQVCTFTGNGSSSTPVTIIGEGSPLFHWGSSIQESKKLEITGGYWHIENINGTQSVRGVSAADRFFCCQEGGHDTTFERCTVSETYEAFKASAADRVRFRSCTAYDAQICFGYVGNINRGIIENCTMHDFTQDGVQFKAGAKNLRVTKSYIVGNLTAAWGISLGNGSVVSGAFDWVNINDVGEAIGCVADHNVIYVPVGGRLTAGVMFYGAYHCGAFHNTLIGNSSTTHYTDGLMDAFDLKTATNSDGWANGDPLTNTVHIEGNVSLWATETIYTHDAPLGTNIYRNNTNYAPNWNVGVGSLTGTWTFTNNVVRDPQLLQATGAWNGIDARLGVGSLDRGANVPVSWTDQNSEIQSLIRDYRNYLRGPSSWDRGAYQSTPTRQPRKIIV